MKPLDEKPNEPQPWLDKREKPFLEIVGVTKKFGPFTAVDNVSLEIYQNELFCLLGGSGCGKTTLLRMLAGFETPTEGKILIDGVDVTDLPPYERPMNMMFQSYAIFPHMSVEKNIAYGLKRERMANGEIRNRVEEALELVQMSQFSKRKPHQLSGGQRQRVALARAIVKQPKVLLLDEPLAALDKKLREKTQFELIDIQDRLGITFIVVTHDQEEAMTLSTRIAVMNKGQFVQIGTPTDIYEYPQSRFTANFIGSINIFEGVVEKDQPDSHTVKCEGSGCDLLIDRDSSIHIGESIGVAIRPEKIHIAKEKPVDNQFNTVRGKILDFGYLGNLSVYNVKLDSGKIVKVSSPNQQRFSKHQVDWDDIVYLSWEAGNTVVLSG
jgi:putrescine transport system ATP-binding protein